MKNYSREQEKTVLVLDTVAFLSGYALYSQNMLYTVDEVVDEIRDKESRRRFEELVSSNKLKIMKPSKRIDPGIIGSHLYERLSRADLKILELALELREKGYAPLVVTDDYAIQKACVMLGLKYVKVRYPGIKEK